MNLGFLYAGQGSQHPGMGADLYERFPAFRAVLDSAAARVDFDLKEVSFTDTKGVLNQTHYTQPCMVAFAAGMTALLAERDIVPAAAAGLSLGEYSALHAAGVFDADTAVELVAFRGKAMEDAAAGRPSAMVAVLGLDRAALQEACDEASARGCVVIANYNCPGQLVISGSNEAVDAACAKLTEAGAKRALKLNVGGAFHSPLMNPAKVELEAAINATEIHTPKCPVYQNVDALPHTDPAEIKANLVAQLTASVRWTQTVKNMVADGADDFTECGPGAVLQGLIKKIDGSVNAHGIA